MSSNFLVSGMFRSGTTMLARMLHANPNIVCASDPFAPLFKSYRNTVAKEMFRNFDFLEPLNDYYFNKNQNHLFQELQKKDFSVTISRQEVKRVRKEIENHCKPYSSKIIPYLDMLKGNNYKEIFDSAFEIIGFAYGKNGGMALGFKEVWVDEFALHFNKMKKGNKVIHLIRDPRSVVASNFKSGNKYPLLFLIRQWRKLASIAWLNSKNNENVLLVKFEDLIENPEKVANLICDFIGVEFHLNMITPEEYKDGEGEPWKQNSSYENKERQIFNSQSLRKWSKFLSRDVVNFIEIFCSFEMNLLNYKKKSSNFTKDIGYLLDYQDDLTQCSEWIKPYAVNDNFKEVSAELARYSMLKDKAYLSKETCKLFFLVPGIESHIAK
jgi:hypothetical protein